MATKAAIAAKDRASREKIAKEDRAEKKRQFDKSYQLDKDLQTYKKMQYASGVTKDLAQAAYGKQGVAGGMSGKGNDPSWYKKFGLSNYATNLPTFYRLGMEIKPEWYSRDYNDVISGITTFNYVLTLPNQLTANVLGNKGYQHSPINQCMTRFMAEVRKLNSRIGDYDPSDIALYWYGNIGILIDISKVTKALKGYNTYYSSNRYFSRAFIKSCGFDPDDFITHVPQYKADLIRWIELFNKNAVIPNSLDFIKREFWLANVVIREHKTDNSQIYHFNTPFTYHLNDDETYVSVSILGSDNTYATFKSRLDGFIESLYNSTGVVTMTADLRAAFPQSVLLKYPDFMGNETLIYSESIHDLEQVHNLRTLPLTDSDYDLGEEVTSVNNDQVASMLSKLNIVVDNDGYLAQGAFNASNQLLPLTYGLTKDSNLEEYMQSLANGGDNNVLNFYDSEFISDDSVLEATRLRQILYSHNDDFGGCAFKYNGTEVITCAMIITCRTDSPDPDIYMVTTEFGVAQSVTPSVTAINVLTKVTSFDWFPWIRVITHDDEDFIFTFGEFDHVVYLANENLKLLHEGCVYSLFFVDDFAKGHIA